MRHGIRDLEGGKRGKRRGGKDGSDDGAQCFQERGVRNCLGVKISR